MLNSSRKSYVQKKIIADKEHGIHNQSSSEHDTFTLYLKPVRPVTNTFALWGLQAPTWTRHSHRPAVAWYWCALGPSSFVGVGAIVAHAIQNKNRKKDQRPFFTMIGVLLANQKRPGERALLFVTRGIMYWKSNKISVALQNPYAIDDTRCCWDVSK